MTAQENALIISAAAGGASLVLHAFASCAVNIIRAWKSPVTTPAPKDATHLALIRPGPMPITPTPPKDNP